jgi:peptidoglycan/LPS O-acetylase OafA/YrhL
VFQLLNLRIGFVPQYIGLYIFGLNVDPNKIDLLPRGGLRAHLAIIIAVLAVYVKFNLNGPIGSLLEDHSGGLNSTAATYAILNEFVGYLLLATAFTQFRSHFNSSCGAVTTVSYAMFLVHPPVSVAVEVVTDDWKERALPKTAVIGFINSMFSVVAGWLLKQLPGAGKVL